MSLPTDYAARKAIPLFDFLTGYFPDALVEVTKVAVEGNKQHNPGEKLHWARGKSMDQLNTAMRHMFDHAAGNGRDTDGCWHLAKAAWRLLAEIQLLVEEEAQAAPKALAEREAYIATVEAEEHTATRVAADYKAGIEQRAGGIMSSLGREWIGLGHVETHDKTTGLQHLSPKGADDPAPMPVVEYRCDLSPVKAPARHCYCGTCVRVRKEAAVRT